MAKVLQRGTDVARLARLPLPRAPTSDPADSGGGSVMLPSSTRQSSDLTVSHDLCYHAAQSPFATPFESAATSLAHLNGPSDKILPYSILA